MLPLWQTSPKYERLDNVKSRKERLLSAAQDYGKLAVACLLLLSSMCAYWHWYEHRLPSKIGEGHCTQIHTRREWRTLNVEEKKAYTDAVRCLKTKDSRLDLNQTLYDDFPWIHSRIGSYGTYAGRR
jgi:hypothetical protein